MCKPEYIAPYRPSECPACHSANLVKVITGCNWHDTEEDEELCRAGKAVKYDGYCCIDDMPKWQCPDCKQYIHKAPTGKIYIFKLKPEQCPVCNSPRIMDVIYGDPCFRGELRRQIRNGEVVSGGCCITDNSPAWQCRDCLQDLHSSYPL